MKSAFLRRFAVPATMVLLSAAGIAQSVVTNWKGELHTSSPRLFDGYTAELSDQRQHGTTGRADIRWDGSFEFSQVAPGMYELVISDGGGHVVYRDMVEVSEGRGPIEIRLPDPPVQRPPDGPVSVSQLRHPPAPKAIARARAAQKRSEAGEYAKAAAELEAAVLISPDFADARTNLGAQYLRLGRYGEAFDQLQRAAELQPTPAGLTNLAYAELMLSRPKDAINTARQALRLDGDRPAAHYILGLALAATGSKEEAIEHLERAAERMPTARANLERLRTP